MFLKDKSLLKIKYYTDFKYIKLIKIEQVLIDLIAGPEAGYPLGFFLFFHTISPNPQEYIVPTLLMTLLPFFSKEFWFDDKLHCHPPYEGIQCSKEHGLKITKSDFFFLPLENKEYEFSPKY